MADNTNAGACLTDNECFIQTLGLYQYQYYNNNIIEENELINILFSGNTKREQGANNIFGGLLDRCIPSPFAEVYIYLNKRNYYIAWYDIPQ